MRGPHPLSGHCQCSGLAITTQGWSSQHDLSLPLGTLGPVVKAMRAGEAGALVGWEASPQVSVHRWTHLGLFPLGYMSLCVRGTFRAKGWSCYWTGQAKHSTCHGTEGWKHRWPGPAAPAEPRLPTHTSLHTSGPRSIGTFQWQAAVLAPKPSLKTPTYRLAF